jgi:uncharacterized protein (TIGR03086 family)
MNLNAEMTDAAGAAARTVAHVDASQFNQPTPCGDWDTRVLLNHLILWTSYSLMDRDFAADPGFVADYQAQLDRALAAWSEPAVWERSLDMMGTPTPASDIARLIIAEMVLHGWDLAAATGQRFEVGDQAVAVALKAVEDNAEMFRKYEGFAEPVEVPSSAPLLDQVLGASGRDPSWKPAS